MFLEWCLPMDTQHSNMASFFRFVDKRAIYRWYNLNRTYAGSINCVRHFPQA
jgi:hypothetical protein